MSIQSLAGRIGGYARAAQYDGRDMTAAARRRFAESFLEGHACRVCPNVTIEAGLLPEERSRRAEALRRAHFARVALASAKARSKRRARPDRDSGGPTEADRDRDRTPTAA